VFTEPGPEGTPRGSGRSETCLPKPFKHPQRRSATCRSRNLPYNTVLNERTQERTPVTECSSSWGNDAICIAQAAIMPKVSVRLFFACLFERSKPYVIISVCPGSRLFNPGEQPAGSPEPRGTMGEDAKRKPDFYHQSMATTLGGPAWSSMISVSSRPRRPFPCAWPRLRPPDFAPPAGSLQIPRPQEF
jgi:hypothetical protein